MSVSGFFSSANNLELCSGYGSFSHFPSFNDATFLLTSNSAYPEESFSTEFNHKQQTNVSVANFSRLINVPHIKWLLVFLAFISASDQLIENANAKNRIGFMVVS